MDGSFKFRAHTGEWKTTQVLKAFFNMKKSVGGNQTEQLLSRLCDKTFLKLWSYANPYKDDGKELCDLIVIFEDVVIIFFVRNRTLDSCSKDNLKIEWNRWKKKVIDDQIKTAYGAERYISQKRKIYLDGSRQDELPIQAKASPRSIYKIVVAYGADEECSRMFANNLYGSLAIRYADDIVSDLEFPFLISLQRDNPTHILDGINLPILLTELDTIWDFCDYLEAKEKAIKQYEILMYCGEEDLLANYFTNFDEVNKCHYIGSNVDQYSGVLLDEGLWDNFINRSEYVHTKRENEISQFWDELIQRTSENALTGDILGQSPLDSQRSPIHEMAKEPRFMRRELSRAMLRAVKNFPEKNGKILRHVMHIPSFHEATSYVFLQIWAPADIRSQPDYRKIRTRMLEIACGVARNMNPRLETIVGIAMDAPKHTIENSEDFLLMDCSHWTEEDEDYYRKENTLLKIFESGAVEIKLDTTRFLAPN